MIVSREGLLLKDDKVVHGTYDGYHNHGCRCRPCKDANTAWYRNESKIRAARADCSVPGCDGGLYAKGMCHAHYERQRTGRPLTPVIKRRPNAQGPQPGKRW